MVEFSQSRCSLLGRGDGSKPTFLKLPLLQRQSYCKFVSKHHNMPNRQTRTLRPPTFSTHRVERVRRGLKALSTHLEVSGCNIARRHFGMARPRARATKWNIGWCLGSDAPSGDVGRMIVSRPSKTLGTCLVRIWR